MRVPRKLPWWPHGPEKFPKIGRAISDHGLFLTSMRVLSFLILLTFVSCSSSRTQYQKFEKKEGGYRDTVLSDGIHATSFEANSLTKRTYANLFARFRSLEECRHEGKSYSHILGIIDRSSVKKVMRSDGDYWGPSYYGGVGMSPFYSRYSGFGFSTGINFINSRSWEETLVYPDVEVIYHCTEKVYEPEVVMRDVPPDEMKHLVKDLKGGVQVEKILPGSPNRELKEEDIIIRAQGKRVVRGYEVLALFKDGPRPVSVEVLREGEKKSLTLHAGDVTEVVEKNLSVMKGKACRFEDVKKKSSLCRESL